MQVFYVVRAIIETLLASVKIFGLKQSRELFGWSETKAISYAFNGSFANKDTIDNTVLYMTSVFSQNN